jgi:hypothetical protein
MAGFQSFGFFGSNAVDENFLKALNLYSLTTMLYFSARLKGTNT